MTIVVGGKNTIRRIDAVWAAVSVDDDGTEGLCAVFTGSGWMPLLAADEDRLPFVRQQAAIIATRDSRKVYVIRLAERSVIEEFDGRQ